jgi:hypothetical protein
MSKELAEKMRGMASELMRSADALMSGSDGRAESPEGDQTNGMDSVDHKAMSNKKDIAKSIMVSKLKSKFNQVQ